MQNGRRPKFTLDSRSSKQTSRKGIAVTIRPLPAPLDTLSLYGLARNQRYDNNSKEIRPLADIREFLHFRRDHRWEEDKGYDSLRVEMKKAK